MELVGFGETIKTTATEIHIFNSPVNQCSAGEHVGILARGYLLVFFQIRIILR
jgi:translation elongation factor EF-Tu-like GTPase